MLTASPALAHAFLERASPRVGSALAAAPREVHLYFSEPVEPLFTRIEVRDASGARMDRGGLAVTGGGTEAAIGLIALPDGVYTVEWHATSVDMHRSEGQFRFIVGP